MSVLRTVRQMVFLGSIILLPMVIDGIGDLDRPSLVFDQFQQFSRGKELDAIL
jgi:hypothetical protein